MTCVGVADDGDVDNDDKRRFHIERPATRGMLLMKCSYWRVKLKRGWSDGGEVIEAFYHIHTVFKPFLRARVCCTIIRSEHGTLLKRGYSSH